MLINVSGIFEMNTAGNFCGNVIYDGVKYPIGINFTVKFPVKK